jgi:hypothetical protein
MRAEVVAGWAASDEAQTTAEGDVCRFKMPFVQLSGAAGHGKRPGLSGQAHVGAGVREHVKRLGWKTRYDESTKLFDESLQKS